MSGREGTTIQYEQEKRSCERQTVDAVIKYRTAKMDHFAQGRLVNISENGILISVDQPLELSTRIYFVVETNNPRVDDLHVIASVVRKRSNKQGGSDYGCKLIETSHQKLSPSMFTTDLTPH